METSILSVGELIALVNQTLEYAYPVVVVEGEVSSFKVSKDKFVFFDLKDDEGAVSCFMMVYQLRSAISDGMKVRVTASPKLTAWGKFSLTVRAVAPVGEGSIKKSFELLRARLAGEGLFDPERKRSLPAVPTRIGLVASVGSAGYVDFLKILDDRWGGIDITVADVLVQGADAAEQIISALQYFNEQAQPVEVVALVRGGGSLSDLAVWNDEPLVRAIAASRIPTLVGVGHEVDTSLSDLAADVRAATPSNAAQLLAPDRAAVMAGVRHHQRHMLTRLSARHAQLSGQVTATADRLLDKLQRQLGTKQRQVAYAQQVLRQLDPGVLLSRGYALVRDGSGRLVRGDARQLRPDDTITIELSNATINAGVRHVQAKK